MMTRLENPGVKSRAYPKRAEAARRFGPSFDTTLLGQLPKNERGFLPWHQAGAALDLARLNFDPANPRRLPVGAANYPAIAKFAEGDAALLLDARDGEILVWRPGTGLEQWEAHARLAKGYAGTLYRVFGDPDEMRHFAQMLRKFTSRMQGDMVAMQGALNNLGQAWRDQEFQKFSGDFEDTMRQLQRFSKSCEDHAAHEDLHDKNPATESLESTHEAFLWSPSRCRRRRGIGLRLSS